jgi:hypothetical protein
LVGTGLGKRLFGSPERIYEDNINMNVIEMDFKDGR